MRRRLTHHSLTQHALAPLWARVPARTRWRIVHALNRSNAYCWSDLVDAALAPDHREKDPCDDRLPFARGGERCRTVCGFGWQHEDHSECRCYCGKFALTKDATHVQESGR